MTYISVRKLQEQVTDLQNRVEQLETDKTKDDSRVCDTASVGRWIAEQDAKVCKGHGSYKMRLPLLSDMHVHFREVDAMPNIAKYHDRYARYVVAMPNLNTPLTTGPLCSQYRSDITMAFPKLIPIVPLYLTNNTTAIMISQACHRHGVISAKLYPAGVTTGSGHGVVGRVQDGVLSQMQDCGMILSVHAESPYISVMEAEDHYVQSVLVPLVKKYPRLKVIVEHVSTRSALDFVWGCGANVAATITPQHMMFTIDDLLGRNGLHPSLYCKPVLKRNKDRLSIIAAAMSGDPKFFLGIDSAPHANAKKYCECGCAGVFSAPQLPEILLKIFMQHDCLAYLADFASNFGADFYGLNRTKDSVSYDLDNLYNEVDSQYPTLTYAKSLEDD